MRRLTVSADAFDARPDLTDAGDDPAHARIERWVTGLVREGRLVATDRLPPEGDLAAALGVSRMTLRQALASLEQRGLVERRRGRGGGTFVTRPRVELDLTGLLGFTEQLRRARIRAGARVLTATRETAPADVAEGLALPGGGAAHRVVRVRLADDEPLALEETWLPAPLFDGIADHDLTGSIYELMGRHFDAAPRTADEWLEPVVATSEQAALLGIRPHAPLMLVTRIAYDAAGLPVELAHDRYRADRTRVHLRTQVR
ncbi:GntR family transcriptional regulator [Solicola sp. PLA-1-18]|uniref:GntR family transcriptional regulator n=1 Tax=Solicola sp. PLA-1-18 TaxID=3380532 RepID=UPI003B7EB9AB